MPIDLRKAAAFSWSQIEFKLSFQPESDEVLILKYYRLENPTFLSDKAIIRSCIGANSKSRLQLLG